MRDTDENDIDVIIHQLKRRKSKLITWNSLSDSIKLHIRKLHPKLIPAKAKDKLNYYRECKLITETNKTLISDISNRKFRQYDIDHIVPISYGFQHNISPLLIGSIDNLRIISHIENAKKSSYLSNDAKQLLSIWGIRD